MKIEDYNKYYIQNSNHYLIPKDVFMELFNEMSNWKEDTKKYKEVIDRALKFIDNYMYENYCYVGSEDKLKDILKKVESDE